MEFLFFRFRTTDKMDSVMKGLRDNAPPQNFWARTAPGNIHFHYSKDGSAWHVNINNLNMDFIQLLGLHIDHQN